jgi:hypothetical protein
MKSLMQRVKEGQSGSTPKGPEMPKISFETTSLISSKLKERLTKSRRQVATKKIFEKLEVKTTDIQQPRSTRASILDVSPEMFGGA